jgi:hypothetical protein
VTDAPLEPIEKNNFKAYDLFYNAKIQNTDLRSVWAGGYVSASPIKEDSILQTAGYLTKYMSKEYVTKKGIVYSKRFSTTQNLNRPKVYLGNDFVKDFDLSDPKFYKEYKDKYKNDIVTYSLFTK